MDKSTGEFSTRIATEEQCNSATPDQHLARQLVGARSGAACVSLVSWGRVVGGHDSSLHGTASQGPSFQHASAFKKGLRIQLG